MLSVSSFRKALLFFQVMFFSIPIYCAAMMPLTFATSIEIFFEANAVALTSEQRAQLADHLEKMASKQECRLIAVYVVPFSGKGVASDLADRRKTYLADVLKRHGIPPKTVRVSSGRLTLEDMPTHENAVKVHFIGEAGAEGCEVRPYV